MRKHLDVSAYLIVGPENTLGRPVPEIVGQAVAAGFTCVQLRSKTATAREMIALCRETAAVLAQLGKAGAVPLLVDDRLDVVLAARARYQGRRHPRRTDGHPAGHLPEISRRGGDRRALGADGDARRLRRARRYCGH